MQKLTQTYATHGIPLDCDIYTTPSTPSTNPVVLFFHAGGLVGSGRDSVPPWLIQVPTSSNITRYSSMIP